MAKGGSEEKGRLVFLWDCLDPVGGRSLCMPDVLATGLATGLLEEGCKVSFVQCSRRGVLTCEEV